MNGVLELRSCCKMLHPEENINLVDFKLPNPDTRLVIFGDAVFKLKYKMRSDDVLDVIRPLGQAEDSYRQTVCSLFSLHLQWRTDWC